VGREQTYQRIEADSDAFLVVRSVASLFLVSTYLVWSPGITERQRGLFIAGTLVWILYTAVAAIVRARRKGIGLPAILRLGLAFDCVALGLLSAASASQGNPMFVWVALETVLYAAVLASSRAWMLSGLFIVANVIGQLAATYHFRNPGDVLFLAMEVLGVVGIGWFVAFAVRRYDERLSELETHNANIAQRNVALVHKDDRLEAIWRISEIVHASLDPDTMAPFVLHTLEEVIDIATGCLYVLSKEKGEVLFRAVCSGDDRLASEKPVEVSPGMFATSDDHFVCTQLLDRDQVSVILCAEVDFMKSIAREDRDLLEAVALELALAVENSQLYKLTKHLAVTDELTDLHNYRSLHARLSDEAARATRYRKRLSLLMIDVDELRTINDVYGHTVADEMLVDVGHIIKANVRQIDEVARYSGGEFAVLLPETEASGAFVVAEKIREAVAFHRFQRASGERDITTSVSVGIGCLPLHADDADALMRAAEGALRMAKEGGKNRVRAASLSMGLLTDSAPEGTSV